jgi:hypothetical protein
MWLNAPAWREQVRPLHRRIKMRKPQPKPQPKPLPRLQLEGKTDRELLDQCLRNILTQTLQLQTDLAAEIDSPFTVPQRINGLKAAATILAVYVKLRELKKESDEQPGSAVHKYAAAFKDAHAARRRETDTGELDAALADFERDDTEGDGADA